MINTMTRRRRQQDIGLGEVIPVIILLIFGLGFSIYQSQESLILITSVLLGVVVLIGLGIFLFDRARKERLRRSGIAQIDLMNGAEFEQYLQVLLSDRGFKNVRKPAPDLGADLIAVKDGVRWAIQAKCYKRHTVKLDAVRQVVATLSYYKCDRAMVITNSYFTSQAKTIAASSNCYLVDRDELIKLILADNS